MHQMKMKKKILKDEFYDKSYEIFIQAQNNRKLILMGDMNGRTGRKIGDPTIGNFGEEIINDNG